MTDCPEKDQLRRLLNEELDAVQRQDVSRHISACQRCQLALDEMTSDTFLPDQVAAGAAGIADHSLRGLMERIRQAPPLPAADGVEPKQDIETQLDPAAPLSLADYEMTRELGCGAMGTVYAALQKSLKKQVAVKVLDRVNISSSGIVERFLREAYAAARLNHPHIVNVHGIGRTQDGGYFLVMDLVQGGNLEDAVAKGRIRPAEVTDLAATIADAIQHAHQQGVVHRDLKPANILLGEDGRIMVTDFGIAKLLSGDHGNLSRDGVALGTPRYMAPEQADSRWGQVGPRTDVYGLGGILHFLLTGQHPFQREAASEVEVIAQLISLQTPQPLRQIRPDVSPTLEAVCMKCLRKQPGERYASAAEVAAALRSQSQHSYDAPTSDQSQAEIWELEPPLGAVPLDSKIYLVRRADQEFKAAVSRKDSIILLRGGRQVGKTSLLARGLQQARQLGMRVALIDFQKLNAAEFASAEALYLSLGERISDQLELDAQPQDHWNPRRGPNVNFENFLRRQVLTRSSLPMVWAFDEVDRLFGVDYSTEVFGLFRSWHNERALDPSCPWSKLTLAIAYATEAHLFITDMNQSPFNVGTRVVLSDFNVDQVAELNSRYDSPLGDEAEVTQFASLVGGQPYLVNRGLYEMATREMEIGTFTRQADGDEGPFGDHLRRIAISLAQDADLRDAALALLAGRDCPSTESFYRLRSAGIVNGDAPGDARLRCRLYATYLERHLA